jgi:hypothetical protein
MEFLLTEQGLFTADCRLLARPRQDSALRQQVMQELGEWFQQQMIERIAKEMDDVE